MGTERVIKRYTNRKLYDTDQSRYVTLEDIARLVRENEEVRVIDNETGDDLTAVTFAQIILEEEKRKTNLMSVPFLRKLIRSGEEAVQDFTDRATRAIDDVLDEGRGFIDDLLGLPQRRLESLRDAARKQVDKIRQSQPLQREIERLEKSIRGIEEMLTRLREGESVGEDECAPRNGSVPSDVDPRLDVEVEPTDDVTDAGDASEPTDPEKHHRH